MSVRIELIQFIKLHVLGDLLDEIDRLEDLHLARNGQLIQNRFSRGVRLLRCAEGGGTGFDKQTRLALVGRRHHAGDHKCAAAGQKRNRGDPSLAPPDGRDKLRKIYIHIPVIHAIAVHARSVTDINRGP